MGAKLTKAFEIAQQAGGKQFEMRLAMKSGISAQKAAGEPDSPDNILKMEAALKEITGQPATL